MCIIFIETAKEDSFAKLLISVDSYTITAINFQLGQHFVFILIILNVAILHILIGLRLLCSHCYGSTDWRRHGCSHWTQVWNLQLYFAYSNKTTASSTCDKAAFLCSILLWMRVRKKVWSYRWLQDAGNMVSVLVSVSWHSPC